MLNPFYEYIGDRLVEFFKAEASKNNTDRYYLYLPTEKLILELYSALKDNELCEPFIYRHNEGTKPYETISLNIGDMKYVIATTTGNTTIDFLVTLRNEMSEQQGVWKNTSIIFICNTLNDSIRGGSKDLTNEGLPLHVKEIVGNLDELMASSSLSSVEKAVTRHYLQKQKFENDIENTTFLDFEDMLRLVKKERIDAVDYLNLQYFPDSEIEDLIKEQEEVEIDSGKWKNIQRHINRRLDGNTMMHEEVERIRTLGNAKERLEEQFDTGGNQLYKEEWYETDYKAIEIWQEKVKSKRGIEFESDKAIAKTYSDGQEKLLEMWRRPKSDTKAGRRNWHFIVFNPFYQAGQTIEINLPFDRHTSQKYLNNLSRSIAKTSGHSIKVNLELEDFGTTFGRVTYNHEDIGSNKHTFNILVLAGDEEFLNRQRDAFLIRTTPKSKRALQLILDDQKLQLGNGENEFHVSNQGEIINLGQGGEIHFNPGIIDEDTNAVNFTVLSENVELPMEVKDEVLKVTPITGQRLWELKRKKQQSFKIDAEAKRVEIDHLPFSTYEKDRKFLLMELKWLQEKMRCATIELGEINSKECELPCEVSKAYEDFIDAVIRTGTILSLSYYDEEVREKARRYVESYIYAIDEIKEQEIMSNAERTLYTLGTAREENKIYMTPFSPLNVAFQLQIDEEAHGEDIDTNVLQRLRAVYTLPYYRDEYTNEVYKPTTEHALPEWLTFLPSKEVTVGETNSYLAKVVHEKLDQFSDHYEYLFAINQSTPLLINVINIPNDKEVVRGIVEWLKKQIALTNNLSSLRNVQVVLYNDNANILSAFDELNDGDNADEIGRVLDIDFKIKDHLPDDALRVIQQSLHYSKRNIEDEIQYSHVTFYKMKNEERVVKQKVRDVPNSLNLNGLFTTVVSTKTENGGYRAGFGVGKSDVKQSLLTNLAVKMNELVANMSDRGQNPYQKEIALAMHIDSEDEYYLQNLYQNSHWLTFIDPVVDLKYFEETSSNIIIVHYSDQHSSSNSYDAITVTDKSYQYFNVIKEFLESQNVRVDDDKIEGVIKAFNTFNGEWLLRAVQNRSYDKREKMSIVSAIKQVLRIFEVENILWVPISMEEIVRVTGNVKLSRKEGIFSGKTIGRRGNCSDDLLMIGLEEIDNDLKVHMYPVEVKIGNNNANVIDKGVSQVRELKDRLTEQLIENDNFDAKFLRNFFMRLFINNATKMHNNKIWPEKNYLLDEHITNRLLNDEFDMVNSMRAELGYGMVISYKKDVYIENRRRREGVVIVEFPEKDGYNTLALPMKDVPNPFSREHQISEVKQVVEETAMDNKDRVAEKQQSKEKSFPIVKNTEAIEEYYVEASDKYLNVVVQDSDESQNLSSEITSDIAKQEIAMSLDQADLDSINTAEVRPLIGYDYKLPIHWEFNQVTNRHLLIGGRSGQGKTYFIQSLLRDLSRANQSAVVIDYSSSYTKKQLEPTFIEDVGNKLLERVVYHEGFPLNPFLLRKKEVAGLIGTEKPSEAATRIVDVFSAVYETFGPQQISALYQAVKKGIEMYGDKMRMELLLEILEDLDGFPKQVLASITSRLIQFVDIDPFDYDTKNQWESYFAPGGQITIIQLDGYEQDEIKKIMAEFILWDIWYYSLDGTKEKPIPVVLDEAQNLDFSDGSPAAKILREGRKFGWSAWFATQTFNNFTKDEMSIIDNAGTKVYFNPAETELKIIAGRIGQASPDELRTLKKGQCLITGQFLKSDGMLGENEYHVVQVPPLENR